MFLDLENEPILSGMDIMYALVAFSKFFFYTWNYCLEVILTEMSVEYRSGHFKMKFQLVIYLKHFVMLI